MVKRYINYWKHNFIFGAQRAWKWLGVFGLIIDAIIALLTGFALGQKNALLISLITVGIALALYILLTLIFTFLVVPFQEYSKLEKIIKNYKKKGKEPPEIYNLALMRTEGVKLRNSGNQLTDQHLLANWQNDYIAWNEDVMKKLNHLSKGKAEWFRTLDKMPINPGRKVLNSEHLRYLSIFDEKLSRLDLILRQYLNI